MQTLEDLRVLLNRFHAEQPKFPAEHAALTEYPLSKMAWFAHDLELTGGISEEFGELSSLGNQLVDDIIEWADEIRKNDTNVNAGTVHEETKTEGSA